MIVRDALFSSVHHMVFGMEISVRLCVPSVKLSVPVFVRK